MQTGIGMKKKNGNEWLIFIGGNLEMKNWKFREDISSHYINATSGRKFKDAEDRLNYLEENSDRIIEQAFKEGVAWKTNGEGDYSMEDAIENAKKAILNTWFYYIGENIWVK